MNQQDWEPHSYVMAWNVINNTDGHFVQIQLQHTASSFPSID